MGSGGLVEGGPHSGKENTSNIPGQQNITWKASGWKPSFPRLKIGVEHCLEDRTQLPLVILQKGFLIWLLRVAHWTEVQGKVQLFESLWLNVVLISITLNLWNPLVYLSGYSLMEMQELWPKGLGTEFIKPMGCNWLRLIMSYAFVA